MDGKPRAIRLAKLEEEPLHSGRKLLHCIFEDRYGNHPQSYRWTAPWRSGSKDCGILQLFYKSYEIEEYNDPEGIWDRELKKAAEEIPQLGEMKLPVKVEIGGAIEDMRKGDTGTPEEYWRIRIEISEGEQGIDLYEEQGEQYLTIGEVNMAWRLLSHEIGQAEGVKLISKKMSSSRFYYPDEYVERIVNVHFWLWIKKTADRIKYQTAARDISFRIRSFIRTRLSEYKSLKKGFREQ